MSELRIYDVTIDMFREATQVDIDNFMALTRAYGRIRSAYKGEPGAPELGEAIEGAHAELMAAVRK